MTSSDLQILPAVLIGVDLAILGILILFLKRFHFLARGEGLFKTLDKAERLMADADKLASGFQEQLRIKQEIIVRLNEELEKRVQNLKGILNRADGLLARSLTEQKHPPNLKKTIGGRQGEMIAMAEKGYPVGEIAKSLSIPEGEVKLVLEFRQRLAQLGSGQEEP